tara:strand:+ start:79 stop:540 length:462 start_codon:yes stop_codon:yes gene_type:complete
MIKHLHFLVLTLFFLSCEKDDICIEGSENTKRITIGFVNNKTRVQTGINLGYIKGMNNDSIISEGFTGNYLKLPLMVNSNETKYILEQNNIKDTLIIFHQTDHLYLNRSCGFKANFLIQSDTKITKNSGWIREVSIEQDSIFNEEKTNIFIYY